MNDLPTLPYGTWPSPISPELAVGSSHGLSEPRPDGDDVYVLESRPEEAGRVALLRVRADGSVTDVAPGLNVRTRVHEYGGGAYTVRGGVVVLSEFAGSRLLWAPAPGTSLVELAADPALRFADLELDPSRGRVIAVLEDQTHSAIEARNTICAVALADGTRSELAAGSDFYSDPRLSPDGRRLAWLSWDFPSMPWDGTDLWVADILPDGGLAAPTHVAGGPAEAVGQPRWAPDGSLVFVSDRSGWGNLYRWRADVPEVEALAPMAAEFAGAAWTFGLADFGIDDDGTIVAASFAMGRTQIWALTPEAPPRELACGADSIDFLRVSDGRAIMVASSTTRPTALVRLDLRAGGEERLRESGVLAIDQAFLAVPRHIAFPTSGGRTAYAWYYPPTNPSVVAPADERPPLVVMSHGGPTSQARTALSLERQAFTSRGFAVVDVDYGGSTGYGRAYRDQLRGQWGVIDVDDCTNAALWLADQGLADQRRLAIRGGSAGGYTTLASLCFRDVFTAGTSFYGLGDLAAFTEITHKYESHYMDILIGPYPEAAERYHERSPDRHAHRIACPVLVMQGADDRIVPPAQAEGIVAALARNGLPHAYLLFEGEGHGFRQAANRRRALEAELSFYAQVWGFRLGDDIPMLALEGLPAG